MKTNYKYLLLFKQLKIYILIEHFDNLSFIKKNLSRLTFKKIKHILYRNTDVIGKPKGQGQEKEVLLNREKKEKTKSARANHNRRQGAQWKRSQGMMPS